MFGTFSALVASLVIGLTAIIAFWIIRQEAVSPCLFPAPIESGIMLAGRQSRPILVTHLSCISPDNPETVAAIPPIRIEAYEATPPIITWKILKGLKWHDRFDNEAPPPQKKDSIAVIYHYEETTE